MTDAGNGVIEQLRALGVRQGDVLLSHVSFRAARPIAGGPHGLIEALAEAVGDSGTLVVPSWTSAFERAFDPAASEVAPTLGIVASLFWRMPGTLRSRTPFAFAARGPHAASIVAAGVLLPPHQPLSPVGRVLGLDGKILLLGVSHDSNTMLHLAEQLADVPYKQSMRLTVFENGVRSERSYLESRHCFQLFARVDAWLEEAGLQTTGYVGNATARLMRARDLVDVVVARLRAEPFSFLHARGAGCAPCDAAWSSVT